MEQDTILLHGLLMTVFRILRTDLGLDASALHGERLLIGRARENDLTLNAPHVALSHAGLCWREGQYWLSNFAAQGTRLNGASVTHAEVMPGDVIQIGAYAMRVTARPTGLQLQICAQSEPVNVSESARVAPSEEMQAQLAAYWQRQRGQAGLAEFAWSLPAFRGNEVTPFAPRRLQPGWSRIAFAVVALAAVTALAFPRAFAPGALSTVHQRAQFAHSPAKATVIANGACLSCHGVTQPLQSHCTSCHTTANFQPALSAKHDALKLPCTTCHSEHRGAQYNLLMVANTLCTNCHQQMHGKAVAYPVNMRGVWSWDGLSQAAWQQHQLPGQTADYTLREQFHMLHGEGRAEGRTRCTDCHLAGAPPQTIKQNVRESCAQCHTLRAGSQFIKPSGAQGMTLCIACHAQHGTERDAKASARADNRQPTTDNR
jgi:predicted CXXCH cytochrome family protein